MRAQLFSEYVVCNVGDQWEGRNPVRFWTTDDYGNIDFDSLDFQPMPKTEDVELDEEPRGLTIAEAKAGLAHTFGILPSAVEITIRG